MVPPMKPVLELVLAGDFQGGPSPLQEVSPIPRLSALRKDGELNKGHRFCFVPEVMIKTAGLDSVS